MDNNIFILVLVILVGNIFTGFYLLFKHLKTKLMVSVDEDSLVPNSTVVYAGDVGVWIDDVRECSSCKLKGHVYQQNPVCVRCGGDTKLVKAFWAEGMWKIKG